MIRTTILALALFLVASCGGTPHIAMAPDISLAQENAMPLPDGIGADGKFVYAIGPLDTISIEVDGLPDLAREVVVDGQGMVSYPMAGAVSAAGLTSTQLAAKIAAQMREHHVRDPRVSVNLVKPASNLITVDGEVAKAGQFPVYRATTLIDAVAMAGSDADFANSSIVTIFRQSAGKQYVGLYDLKAIRLGNYPDPQVYPNDKIVVGESQNRRLLQMLGPFVSLLTTPLIYLVTR